MEGPSVKVIAEKLDVLFKGKKILNSWGNSKKVNYNELIGKKIKSVFSHGKNLLIEISKYGFIKIHFLMYGSYSINKLTKEEKRIRLALKTNENTVYFYNCSVNTLEDYQIKVKDVLDKAWNYKEVLDTIKNSEGYVCDILLDQNILPGVGNIIKVESLFLSKIHPESKIKNIPEEKIIDLLIKTREFSMLFYEVRKKGERLREYLNVYGKRTCKNCGNKIQMKKTGLKRRISYYCSNCQIIY